MSFWRKWLGSLDSGPSISGQRSPAEDPDDDEFPGNDSDITPTGDESDRIVEEAIRRLEEAEHEWSRSWEPDRSAE